MNFRIKEIALAVFAIGIWPTLFLACPPSSTAPPVTPKPDAADSAALPDATVADCQAACDAMARVGCIVKSDCARVMCAANADPRFTHYNTACLEKVLDPVDVAACGVSCSTINTGSLEGP